MKNRKFQIVVTTDILLEYQEVIGEAMGQEVVDDLLAFLNHASNVFQIEKYYYWNLIIADPDDDKFVDAAVAGNVDYIVTNDRHFRVLQNIAFPKVNTITADEFLEMLASQ